MSVMKYAKFIKKAINPHACNMCGARINSGTHYYRFFPSDGYSKTYKDSLPVCSHCIRCHLSSSYREFLVHNHPHAKRLDITHICANSTPEFQSKILGLSTDKQNHASEEDNITPESLVWGGEAGTCRPTKKDDDKVVCTYGVRHGHSTCTTNPQNIGKLVDANTKTLYTILKDPYILSNSICIQKSIDRRKNFINKLKSMKK